MDAIIHTHQLTKFFKDEEVIKPLDFTLEKGEICALIGKNGAGKSTIFKMLAGQLMPTSGEIQLFGKSGKEEDQAKQRMGFMIETPVFFPDFTAKQNLEYFRIQRGVVEKKRIYEVLQIVGLANQKRKRFKERSEEHTSELQSRGHLVCRLLLEKKNTELKQDNNRHQ